MPLKCQFPKGVHTISDQKWMKAITLEQVYGYPQLWFHKQIYLKLKIASTYEPAFLGGMFNKYVDYHKPD